MNKETIGDRIKKKRKNKKITQNQLANILNKSLSSVQKYESGDVEVPKSILEEIAIALDTTIFYLLGYDEAQLDEELKEMFDEYLAIQNEDPESRLFREQLKQIGCYYESPSCSNENITNSYYILKYNNKVFEVPTYEFENLRNSFNSYITFMLQQLIKKYK
ncbi:helix-turn-helix domain-containing protein [Clostridium sp. SHJSY1]|uniref:helix-turn-helix domain-containing protein n=1 Tax=Clostridium sp. SHJSY1 TaxID=2942483 RepID=UPI0028744855|nr:helix-turn-helix domain-containing protein [Clostridium sp. SHJSY1]MDS0526085.1 helix-turn-helix domain-containing protein [Clostridium sp. SHJSY1]